MRIGFRLRSFRNDGFIFAVPTLIETLFLTSFVVVALNPDSMPYGGRAPNIGILGSLVYATVALILRLPAIVITSRYVVRDTGLQTY